MEIRPLLRNELNEALSLVWEVFEECVAQGYSEEGVRTFRLSLSPAEQLEQFDERKKLYWGAFDGSVLTGAAALRVPGHISVLFVRPPFQRQGAARKLMDALAEAARAEGAGELTVHAAPDAQEAYSHLGFAPTAPEQEENGIRYVPMKRELSPVIRPEIIKGELK